LVMYTILRETIRALKALGDSDLKQHVQHGVAQSMSGNRHIVTVSVFRATEKTFVFSFASTAVVGDCVGQLRGEWVWQRAREKREKARLEGGAGLDVARWGNGLFPFPKHSSQIASDSRERKRLPQRLKEQLCTRSEITKVLAVHRTSPTVPFPSNPHASENPSMCRTCGIV
jgi:hypothetical protein